MDVSEGINRMTVSTAATIQETAPQLVDIVHSQSVYKLQGGSSLSALFSVVNIACPYCVTVYVWPDEHDLCEPASNGGGKGGTMERA